MPPYCFHRRGCVKAAGYVLKQLQFTGKKVFYTCLFSFFLLPCFPGGDDARQSAGIPLICLELSFSRRPLFPLPSLRNAASQSPALSPENNVPDGKKTAIPLSAGWHDP